MTKSLTRRAAVVAPLLLAFSGSEGRTVQRTFAEAEARLAELEGNAGGRLGVAALDTGDGARIAYRADERFPLCSTFKFLAAACVLARVDRGEEVLSRRVMYEASDLVPYSPVTELHVGTGMTLAELCAAAMTLSDNTAGNLLLDSFGGPAALTAYARSLGDAVTRLDRDEPELNEAAPGDPRDTTTPAAMLTNLRQIVLGEALTTTSRQQITDWLLANQTGDARLRAGFPDGWRVGDKTGTSEAGVTNDVAVVWPPGRAPLVVAAYLTESPASSGARDAVLAEVGRIVAV